MRARIFLPWTCVGTRKRVSASVALHTPISAVLYRRRCSANYATIAELLVVDDLQPAPPYAPDKTSHAIRHRSPSNRARRISTRACDATQETARYRSAAGQRICSQAAHTVDAKASMTYESRCERTREVKPVELEHRSAALVRKVLLGRLRVIASRNSAHGVHCVH